MVRVMASPEVPQAEVELLRRGFHVAYISASATRNCR